jgi:hypothetical protein
LGACQRRPLHDHRIPHHIADDDAKVSFESDHVAIDGKTGKPVADVTRYTYHDADTSIVVSFERQKTILQAILTDRAPLLKRIIAQLIGFDGAYHRFTGKVTVEKFEGGRARGAFRRSCHLGTDVFRQGARPRRLTEKQ